MGTEQISISKTELEELGAKLDSVDLTDKDRQIIVAAFAVAAKSISDEPEVSGFAMMAPTGFSTQSFNAPNLRQGLSTGFADSLAKGPAADFNNQAIIITVGF